MMCCEIYEVGAAPPHLEDEAWRVNDGQVGAVGIPACKECIAETNAQDKVDCNLQRCLEWEN